MQLKRLAGLAMVAIILLTACGKKGPSYTRYIPKNASYVIAMDVKEMMAKLEKDSLTVENMLSVLKDTSNPSKYAEAIAIWSQFKDAGLDFENKVFLSVPAIDVSGSEVDIQVLAGLKDATKLEDFIKKMQNAPAIKKDGDISYASKEEMIIGWNKEAVMILASPSTPKVNYDTDGGDESAAVAPPVPGEGADLGKLKKYFGLKKEESIAGVAEFNDLLGKKADIAIYTSSSELASMSNPGLAMMPKVKELLGDITSASTINFEDGKVLMEGDTYVGKKLGEIIKQYSGPVVDMDLVTPYPSSNVIGIIALSFKPELLGALAKEAGVDALSDLFLSQKGLTTAEILKAFKGDIAVMVSDFTMKSVEKTNWEDVKYMSTEPSMKVLAAVRIGDKAIFDKLIGLMVNEGNRLLVPAIDSTGGTSSDVVMGIEGDLLVISSDEEVYKAYVAKSSKIGISDDAKAHIKGASIAMYADAGKVLNSIPESILDSNDVHEKNILAKAKPLFKTMSFTTENFDGKKIHGEGEMLLAEGKNSLPQLVRFLMYVAEEMKQKDAEQKAKWQDEIPRDDSTSTVRPVM
jgi:predicted small lipoprotein YifL